jgi:lipopolysaccharide export system permease protein
MTLYASPWGRHAFEGLVFQTATSNIHAGIKERTFNDNFQDVMLYVNQVDERKRKLTDIFLEDRRTEGMITTVVAPRGEVFFAAEQLVSRLRLYDGIINQLDESKETAHFVRFDTYDFRLDFGSMVSPTTDREKDIKEMTFFELSHRLSNQPREKSEEYYAGLIQYHKRLSIPFACFVLGLIAIPLGIQSKSAKRSFGVVIGLFFFLVYYALLSLGLALGETGQCPPVIGMWIPNGVLGLLAAYLLFLRSREQPVKLLSASLAFFQRLRSAGRAWK